MDYATELYGILSLYFTGNKARAVCMTTILIGWLRAASTNLNKATRHMPGGTKFMSNTAGCKDFYLFGCTVATLFLRGLTSTKRNISHMRTSRLSLYPHFPVNSLGFSYVPNNISHNGKSE